MLWKSDTHQTNPALTDTPAHRNVETFQPPTIVVSVTIWKLKASTQRHESECLGGASDSGELEWITKKSHHFTTSDKTVITSASTCGKKQMELSLFLGILRSICCAALCECRMMSESPSSTNLLKHSARTTGYSLQPSLLVQTEKQHWGHLEM